MHEMSNCIFWGKLKIHCNVTNMSSSDFAYRVLNVNSRRSPVGEQ